MRSFTLILTDNAMKYLLGYSNNGASSAATYKNGITTLPAGEDGKIVKMSFAAQALATVSDLEDFYDRVHYGLVEAAKNAGKDVPKLPKLSKKFLPSIR